MSIKMFSVFVTLFVISFVDRYFHFVDAQSIPYVVEFWDESLVNNSVDFDENQIEDSAQNCSQTLAVFAEAATNLTRCTILNARPIRICTICEEEIQDTDKAYHRLMTESPDCHKQFFESDEIGIINLMYKQGIDLWSKGNCKDCYDHVNETKEFFKISKDLDVCMKNFNKTSTEKQDICNKCEELFAKMNYIYRNFVLRIGSSESSSICIDIIDQMNITRRSWSDQHCLKFDFDIGYPNIVTAVVVGCIPVFFYMLSKSISSIEDIKLVRPKRKSYAPLQSESLQVE